MIKFKTFLLLLPAIAVQAYQNPPFRRRLEPMQKLPLAFDPDFSNKLRIPNEAFCDKMESQSLGPIRILPWWTDYCTRLREKQERKRLNDGVIDLSPYRRVLDKIRAHRLKQTNLPKE